MHISNQSQSGECAQRLTDEEIDLYDDQRLTSEIEQRLEAVDRWKTIYWDEFIPFAHGVRRLATYYNDAVQPDDPYEFVGLLRDQPLIAVERNRVIIELADLVRHDEVLRDSVDRLIQERAESLNSRLVAGQLQGLESTSATTFATDFKDLTEQYLDVAFDQEPLEESVETLL